jgi:hypothetical protein
LAEAIMKQKLSDRRCLHTKSRHNIGAELRWDALLGCVLLVDASHLVASGCFIGRVACNDKPHRKAFAERARFDQ